MVASKSITTYSLMGSAETELTTSYGFEEKSAARDRMGFQNADECCQ